MIDSVLLRFMRLSLVLALFCALMMPSARAAEDQAGGVPAAVLLSIGFGDKFDDEKFINVSGLGVLGMVEFFNSDVWITGGLQTSLTFVGELVDSEQKGTKDNPMTAFRDAPSEGWGFSPGIALGLTIGSIPYMDIHLLGTVGASFAFLNRYQYQTAMGMNAPANPPEQRVKIGEMDGQTGYNYGGVVAIAYTGTDSWLRGLTFGVEGAYHENIFNRWHLGFVVGFSF